MLKSIQIERIKQIKGNIMARLIDALEQILDSAGDPLVLGLLDFYETGGSTVRKTTYADSAETIANANPVVIGGDGVVPNIFGTGTYRVVVRTAAGAQLRQRDPVGGDASLSFGADWISTISYGLAEVVKEDGQYWESQTAANAGNQPSLDGGTNWLLFLADVATNTTNIASNTAAIAGKAGLTGAAFTGAVSVAGALSSTAGNVNLKSNTALSDAAATLTAAQLIGGEFTITPTVARIQTTDTAANIIAALGGSVDNSNFDITMINLAAFDVTIAAGTGVTLVGNMVVNDGQATFRVRRLTSSTVSVTRLETGSASSSIALQTAVATTSGTSIDFTGIPSGVKRINIMLNGVSTSGTSDYIVQLGDSGGIETSGYVGSMTRMASAAANTAATSGHPFAEPSATLPTEGGITLSLTDAATFLWSGNSITGVATTGNFGTIGSTSKALSSELTQIRITTLGGSDTFDAGSLAISWEL